MRFGVTAGLLCAAAPATLFGSGPTVNVNIDLGTNTTVVLNQGSITFNVSQHLGGLSIGSTGVATLAANKGYIVSNSASVTSTGVLNLGNGQLIVKGGTLGSWGGAAYTGITGLVMSGQAYSSGYGQWTGAGINSSTAAADSSHNTGVSVLTFAAAAANGNSYVTANGDGTYTYNINHDGSATTVVAGTDVLVRVGWVGDLNGDGILNYNDYGMIDTGYLVQLINPGAAVPAYANGDISGDGIIDYNDYGMLDKAYLAYLLGGSISKPTPLLATASATAVPEPAAVSLAALGTVALLCRRRCR